MSFSRNSAPAPSRRAKSLELELLSQGIISERMRRHAARLGELAASAAPQGRETIIRSENGIPDMGPKPEPGQEDPRMVDEQDDACCAAELTGSFAAMRELRRCRSVVDCSMHYPAAFTPESLGAQRSEVVSHWSDQWICSTVRHYILTLPFRR
jgi:hypothetical protein